jgi:hypothetical protein
MVVRAFRSRVVCKQVYFTVLQMGVVVGLLQGLHHIPELLIV